jgi:predicted amino acid dehydrogenase
MTYITRIVRATTLFTGLALFSYATATAQAATKSQSTATPHVTTVKHTSTSSSRTAPKVTSFRGIASKLNTTPEALETAYKSAVAANRKLTRGQFVAANILAQNLVSKNPTITTQAILDGLKSGKSMGKTLQSLGLSSKDSDKAQDEANSEIRRAEHGASNAPKDSTKSK